MTKNIAIVLASGIGERTKLSIPKQFLKIAGKMVIEHTIDIFENINCIDEIIIVSHINHIERVNDIIINNNYKKISKVLRGGGNEERKFFHRYIFY